MSCLLTCLRMFLRGSSWLGEGDKSLLSRVQTTLWTILKQVTPPAYTCCIPAVPRAQKKKTNALQVPPPR
jgi:hypothetical protein